MRFRIFLAGFVCLGSFFLSSCEECVDCQYKFEDPETKDSMIFEFDEFCGTSDEADDFRDRAKREAQEVDGDLNCQTETEYF